MGIAIIGFVFPHNMQATLEESFTDKIIHTYRDDPDLQNLIDFAQKEVKISDRNTNLMLQFVLIYYVLVSMLWS